MNPMSSSHAAERQRKRPSGRAIAWWIVLALVLILIACVAWIGIRAYLAKNDLEASISLVSKLQTQIASGDAAAAKATDEQLVRKVHSARSLTSDPIWRVGEFTPLVGANLTVVREVADVVADVTDDAVTPLANAAGSLNLQSFKPVNGAVPLQPLIDVAPSVEKANTALQHDLARAKRIDTSGALSIVVSPTKRLVGALEKAAGLTDAANRAVQLLPAMLGSEGPRNYLLLFQNNAELRSTGGIAGALALLHVENGHIALAAQASSRSFPHYPAPVLPLPKVTRGLYGDIAGEYIQDVNLPPQFPLSATLARQMWKQQYGTDVDGVVALDPVALSYLLSATGPVTLATGDQLTSANAVQLLLSDAYARFTDPDVQDAFFASAAAEVFSKISSGAFDPKAMIASLVKSGDEGRVIVWSAHEAEQASLAQTTLAGALPVSTRSDQQFGVYLNDGTGAKMDYYLRTSVDLGQAVCRNDRRPTYSVSVTLTSTAPADAATSLPRYVTGGGVFGVTPGEVRTIVNVYAPPGAIYLGARSGGEAVSVHSDTDDGHAVAQVPVQLTPGQSTTVEFQFLGKQAGKAGLGAKVTPGVTPASIKKVAFRCESALK
jgi:hypothetical protein